MNFQFGDGDFRPIITRLWNERKSMREIGRVVGKAKSTIKKLADRWGLPDRPGMPRGHVAKRIQAARPKAVVPDPIGPIGDFPDKMDCCRFPMNADDQPFQVCGHPGFPWCSHHAAVVVTPRKASHTL